jgi:hypothetical protein
MPPGVIGRCHRPAPSTGAKKAAPGCNFLLTVFVIGF